MSGFIYSMVKSVIKTGLYGYHKKIVVYGLEHIPKDKPVMFLPNHQSALIDVLLIATDCNRKPYFLTRSDVFKGKLLKGIFSYFQMLPIYRMRDGRDTLSNNDAIFNSCADILSRGEALLLFPEANHNLQRRVRPLSKGFTRILIRTFELYPDVDIMLIPVGLNYKHADQFPDQVAINYGKAISAKSMYVANDLNMTSRNLKNAVSLQLKQLTTHIPIEQDYDTMVNLLNTENVDFLNPTEVNNKIRHYTNEVSNSSDLTNTAKGKSVLRSVFNVLNFPMIIMWHKWLMPKVPEKEFMGTFRFAFILLVYPLYLLLLFVGLSMVLSIKVALTALVVLVLLNLWFVKKGLN
ncbi:lysophospholipid acyltransferase family protein [Maribacter dokdonensis]|uniref:lysophospholipid acyltransferase family protein n=1 Tax=Maribacter dokdonensis TaxID=320912 RepID=UPI0007198D53|nr:lysophospholipid acyltransferase family protein [Maribacter dokdonensis]